MRSNNMFRMLAPNSNRLHVAAIGALLFLTICGAKADSVTVHDAWIRALPPSVPSGGYFTLHNGSSKPVSLTGAHSAACDMLMLHKSENHGGMGSMSDAADILVPAGGTLRFAPGGYHLMCMGAKPIIKPGAAVPVTLTFRDGNALAVIFQVRNAAGK